MTERDALTANLTGCGEANSTDDEPDEPDEQDTARLLPRRPSRVDRELDRNDFYNLRNHDSSSNWRRNLATRIPSIHQVFARSSLKSTRRSHRSRPATSLPKGKPSSLSSDLKSTSSRGFLHTVQRVIWLSKLNVLLIFVPLGLISNSLGLSPTVSFSLNALAIIPLTRILTYATENVAQTVGVALGALLNISLGNLVEMLILFMLREGHVRILLASLLGSIFVNLLFILGVAILAGGIRYKEQKYNVKATQTLMYLMSTGVLCLLMPTSLHACINKLPLADSVTLKFSRGMSVTLLGLYVVFLYFQLGKIGQGYEEVKQYAVDEEARYEVDNPTLVNTPIQETSGNMIPMHTIGPQNLKIMDQNHSESDDGSTNEPDISTRASVVVLVLSASLASISAEFLVSAIEPVLAKAPLTETFLGLIILPLLGNAAEFSTAVTVAIKNKMDLAINVTVGSGIQISLFIAPAIVALGWITGKDVALYFDTFQTLALLITVVMVNMLLLSGRSNSLFGVLLCACYVIIGMGAYVLPNGVWRYRS